MLRAAFVLLILAGIAAVVGFAYAQSDWRAEGPLTEASNVVIPPGATQDQAAYELERAGVIDDVDRFRIYARLFGSDDHIRAGEFRFPAGTSKAEALDILQHAEPVQRRVTVPEGLPSVLVAESIMAAPFLTGTIEAPAEGSVLPATYNYERGESRQALLERMQQAMDETLAELWPDRSPDTPVSTPEEAVILASVVEKETATPKERPMIAGVYANRLRQGIMLQADPTIIYPITKGKPLGRRIRRSEIAAVNDYNTYAMAGLPKGPIANPGRAAIEAVLHPAETDALYFVADGTGGHVFAETLAEHNRNVAKWYDIRRERGEME